jgi:acetoacetyl-[acyl-carrier protein] synthase
MKSKLAVIVGIGGINSAGRSSGFHSYKRLVWDALSKEEMANTWLDLANRMGLNHDGVKDGMQLSAATIAAIKENTLIRKINNFDTNNVVSHHKATLDSAEHTSFFIMKKMKLPDVIPDTWQLEELENNEVKITIKGPVEVLIPTTSKLAVSTAANIPTGFDPGKLYNSHHHPRGLKFAIYGASDVINSLGFEWDDILKHIKPDEVSVYAGSALAQLDENSLTGLIGQPLMGNRINSKMLALSLADMPADFINSYVINSIGSTGTNMGACATFLYNLNQGIQDIKHGKAKVVIVGNAEAPIAPEIIEGFRVMGALATDEGLCELDNVKEPDHSRACRPFSTNIGFTIAESSQFFVLMEAELALTLGATIYGSVADVFISADANKKSITGPGVGNYVTVAKATALAKAILGQEGLNATYVQAHGTGTPQNRTTESHILNEVAKAFSIENWPIAAIKAYLGHPMSVAAGDQLMAALGVWEYGFIPGIKTIDHIANDVYHSHLHILRDHYFVGEKGENMKAAIINAKGFGGNNASGLILSPQQTLTMLAAKFGENTMADYQKKNQTVKANSHAMDLAACQGNETVIYKFGKNVMDQHSVTLTDKKLTLTEFKQDIDLALPNPYQD